MLQEWLKGWLQSNSLPALPAISNQKYYLAGHCTERTQVPASTAQWQSIFKAFEIELEPLALGCCGMAGTYGHEAEHRQLSEQIYQQSWQEKQIEYGESFLVTGYSCRSQIKRLQQEQALHPIQILNHRLQAV
jgi:Fe-S oxidoreductase